MPRRTSKERQYVGTAKQEVGRKGDKARAEALTPERRQQIAKQAAAKCWDRRLMCQFVTEHVLDGSHSRDLSTLYTGIHPY